MPTSRCFASLVAAAGLFTAIQARAATVVLDGANGAVYDAVGDGWLFAGPSSPPPDGVGDAGAGSLTVGAITNVLEIRAMAEFGLTPLAGIDANDIISATLTVTIDDVIGTFGPGAAFDGTASSPIAVGTYAGDGAVTLSDYAVATSALGTITPGVVTDATLTNTGPLPFDLDVTTQLRAAVAAANTAFGVKLTTADSPTATSLDDLSPPAPVAGGKLPFVTVIVADPTTTTTIDTTTTSTTLETTTTSSTIAPTTTIPTTTTSTSTTTPPSTTTTTTLPDTCVIAATYASIRCRLDELAATGATEPSLAGVAAKLTTNLDKANALLDTAESAEGRATRTALRKLGTRLRAIGRPLRSLHGRRTIDEQVRADMLATLEGLVVDVKTLMKAS